MSEAEKRRLAVQLAGQLPECCNDALGVLDLTKELVRDFLANTAPRVASIRVIRSE